MAEFKAGEVTVPVVPDARGFIKDLKKQLLGGAQQAAREIGQQIQRGIQEQVRDVRVGVGADTSGARAAVAQVRSDVERLARQSARVQVDADTSAAQAGLTGVRSLVGQVNGERARVQVDADTAAATANLAAADGEVSRLDGRTAGVRVDADVAGALAGIGLVTAALATIPVAATAALGAGALGGALAAAGVGFAGLAAVAVPSLTRINEASTAQEAAMKAAATATQSGGQAAAQAASQAYSLEAAERRVTDAKRTAKTAEEDLTRARQEAKRAIEDLARASANAALDEESAALAVEEARQRLAEVSADPKAGDLERRRAELEVRQAEQRAKDAKTRARDTAKAEKDAAKAGIEGSDQVVAAKEKIRVANQRIKDSEAQLRVAQLQSAAAAKSGGAAQANLLYAMSKLSPAAKTAAREIGVFKDAYMAWQRSLEPAVLPAVTGALKVVQTLFKPLAPLIKGSAGALVGLEKAAVKALGGDFWQSFFKDLSAAAPKAITGLGKSFGSVATGIAGVVKAFLPFVPAIVGGLQKATAAFATWGKNLGQSAGFKTFIAFVKANIPTVIELVKNVASAVGNIISALAPFGAAALAGISGLAGWISKLSPGTIQAIAIAIGGIVLAVKAWAIAQRILNVVLSANPIGLIIALIGLLVAAFVYAYQNSETFRAVVTTVWEAIKTAIVFAWENFIKPALDALVQFWQTTLAPALLWLWNNVIKPAWAGISAAIQLAWTSVIQPALKAIWNFLTVTLAPKILWFHKTIVEPTFKVIGTIIKFAWDSVIKPAFTALFNFITQTLAPKVLWFHKTIVEPTFKAVGAAIKFAWDKVIKPTFDFLYKTISETIPNGFKNGVAAIGKFWQNLQEIAKKPVNFVIETVYNNGIVKVWNAVADAVGLKDLKLTPIPKLAKGGIYPGYTPGRDIGLAAVSGGEAIMRPEWTRAVGEDYINSANSAARSGGVAGVARFLGVAGDPGFAGAFAGGGIVGNITDILAGGLKLGAEKLLNPLLSQAKAAMGDSPLGRLMFGLPQKMITEVIKSIGVTEEKHGGGKSVAFARAQIGKPYKWGATGPDAYDCSGLTMRALQAAGFTDVPRVTYDQINYGKAVKSPIAGDLGFPHDGHVWLYSGNGKIIEAPYTGAKVREVAARSAMAIRRPTFDDGGYLMPGTSLVHNGTGRPEPVLTDQQWQSMGAGAGSGGRPLVGIENFNATPEQSPYAIASELRFILGQGVRSYGRR